MEKITIILDHYAQYAIRTAKFEALVLARGIFPEAEIENVRFEPDILKQIDCYKITVRVHDGSIVYKVVFSDRDIEVPRDALQTARQSRQDFNVIRAEMASRELKESQHFWTVVLYVSAITVFCWVVFAYYNLLP